MAAYRRIYDSRHLQADCQEPGSSTGTLRSVMEYGLLLTFTLLSNNVKWPKQMENITLRKMNTETDIEQKPIIEWILYRIVSDDVVDFR